MTTDHHHSWRDHAACRGEPIATFFGPRGEVPHRARTICATCSVQAECLADALDPSHGYVTRGVWAGTTGRERAQMLRPGAAGIARRVEQLMAGDPQRWWTTKALAARLHASRTGVALALRHVDVERSQRPTRGNPENLYRLRSAAEVAS